MRSSESYERYRRCRYDINHQIDVRCCHQTEANWKHRGGMGVFKEMYDGTHFESGQDYTELRRMLSQAISRGFVEQIAVIKPILSSRNEEWYRDTETGEMYCLVPPGEKSRGWWTRIDSEDLVQPGETVQ